jgi:hypothetical protein
LPLDAALPDGLYRVRIIHRDLAARTFEATHRFTIDTSPPLIQVSSPGNFTSDTTPTLSFSVTEANPGTTRCVIDGQIEIDPCNSGISLPPLTTGAHSLTIDHTDVAGNVASLTITFVIEQDGGENPPDYCPPGYICLPTDPSAPQ